MEERTTNIADKMFEIYINLKFALLSWEIKIFQEQVPEPSSEQFYLGYYSK